MSMRGLRRVWRSVTRCFSTSASGPHIHPGAFVAPNATIIHRVAVGEESSIWYNCVLRGDVASIRIGKRSNIQDGTIIHVARPKNDEEGLDTTIGDGVTVGHMAVLHACTIEDNAFVGMKACVMDGARVKSYGMLAAGSLLTPGKVVESGELWGGSPAKLMRKLKQEEISSIKTSADDYVETARNMHSLPSF
ncbi:hypothetical protein AAMO2058_001633400 [Amorphochlora amoebiformis]